MQLKNLTFKKVAKKYLVPLPILPEPFPYPFIYQKITVFTEFEKLWLALLSQAKYQDTANHSQKINAKQLKKLEEKFRQQGKSVDEFKDYKAKLVKDFIGLNAQGFTLFLRKANEWVDENYGLLEADYLISMRLLTDFIEQKNKTTRLKNHYYAEPAPPQKAQYKSNTLRMDEFWVTKGMEVNKIVKLVLDYWVQEDFFKTVNKDAHHQKMAIGSLLFSGIVFGAINDKKMLLAWLKTVVSDDLQPFINHRIIAKIRYESENYGNERVDETLYNSQQICVDLISQLWLVVVRKIPQNITHTYVNKPINEILQYFFKSLLLQELRKFGELPTLLKYASYCWENTDNVRINQTSVGVLQGTLETCGLPNQDFDLLTFNKFNYPNRTYDLNNLNSTVTNTVNRSNQQAIAINAQIRHSDLIQEIIEIFRTKYSKLRIGENRVLTHRRRLELHVEDLKSLSHTFNHVAEQILIDWIISLLSGDRPIQTSSVEKYLSAMGYDWLWYTVGEDLFNWTSDDFESMYEKIIDFKKSKLENIDIGYPANCLQRLHNFAHKNDKYLIAEANIPEAKRKRKVRVEWISPNYFQAIVQQIRKNIDPLDADMLILLYLLAMRTGARKMELVGLRYSDIENLDSGKPCIIIRPNNHRRLKTEVSTRRLPLYALLSEAELNFFIDYIQANRGRNKQQLIFTLSYNTQSLSQHLPTQFLKQLVTDISLIEKTFNFHGFRHTAISNFSLILTSDVSLASAITGFSENEVIRIKDALLRRGEFSQFKWYMVSGLAGHISPERGIEYYNHFAMLSATYEISKANPSLPLTLIKNLTHISTQNLLDNNITVNDGMIKLLDMQKWLYRKILGTKHSSTLADFGYDYSQFADILDNSLPNSHELFGRYGINKLLALLGHFEQKVENDDIATQLRMPIADIKTLSQRAIVLSHIKTTRGARRFVATDNRVSPMLIDLYVERRMLRQIMTRASFIRQQQPDDWQWFIELITHKVSTAHATITFRKTYQELIEFDRFLSLSEQIFGLNNCMYTCHEPLSQIIANACEKETTRLKQIAQNRRSRRGRVSQIRLYDFETSLQAKMTHKRRNAPTTITFGIKIKDTHSKRFDYKFSSLLRFFAYMVQLQDDKYFEL